MAHLKTISAEATAAGTLYIERGYGQVELNHMAYWKTGQMYAQLPAASTIEILQQGQFAKYDYANNVVNFTGKGEWMMVFNEEKLYEDRETLSDYAMRKVDFQYDSIDGSQTGIPAAYVYNAQGTEMPTGTQMVPRLVKTNIGDIFTLNTIKVATANIDTEIAAGKLLSVGTDGYLATLADDDLADAEIAFQIVKVTTMPDGQRGVKVVRIK